MGDVTLFMPLAAKCSWMWGELMMRGAVSEEGQSLIEYALVIAIVGMAAAAMSVYVYRAVQAQQQTVSEQYQQD